MVLGMELNFTTNAIGHVKFRVADLHGRKHYVVPMALINPGVLNGSKGPLFYPQEEVHRNINQWNGMPLTLGHPYENGSPVSARSPGVLNKYSLGTVLNSRITKSGKLAADGWFDVELTRKRAPEIITAIEQGKSLELSTGLFTENVLAANGSQHNGKAYNHVAKNYKADHVAILLHEKGACSIRDGCGTLVDNCKITGKPGPCSIHLNPDGSGRIRDKHGDEYEVTYNPQRRRYTVVNPGTLPSLLKDIPAGEAVLGREKQGRSDVVDDVLVRGDFKRRGIATALYDHIEKHIGKKLRKSDALLDDGAAFWAAREKQQNPTANGWSEAARIAAIMARRAGRSAKRVLKTAVKKKVEGVKSEVQRVREAIAKKGQGIVDKVAGKRLTPPPLPRRRNSAEPPPLPQKKDKPKPPPLPQRKLPNEEEFKKANRRQNLKEAGYRVQDVEKQGKRSAVPEAIRVKRAVKKVREAKATKNPRRSDSGHAERMARLENDIKKSKSRTAKAKAASKRIAREIKSVKASNQVNTLKRKIGKAKAEARRQSRRVKRLERVGEN